MSGDVRHELRQSVECRLGLAPVVAIAPVADQLLDTRQLWSLRVISDGLLVRPPGRQEASTEISEITLGHIDAERPNIVRFNRAGRMNPLFYFLTRVSDFVRRETQRKNTDGASSC